MMEKWTRALYQPNRPLRKNQRVTAGSEHIALSRKAAAEGMVLLKNENDVLPFNQNTLIAPFGKGIWDMVKGGGGSGDVYTPYIVTLAEGLQQEKAKMYEPLLNWYREDVRTQYAQGAQPGMTREPSLPAGLLEEAAAATDTALLAFSRFSGEGQDRAEEDFILTEEEQALADAVCARFERVAVVLNTGSVIDTSWIRDNERISSAMLMWQAGMEGGRAAASILMGSCSPCGRLPDTFAGHLADYPSAESFHESPDYVAYTEDVYVGYRYFETIPEVSGKVIYPFGYGLSYTSFTTDLIAVKKEKSDILFVVRITNTGERPGKEVTGIYYQAPQGKLGKPHRELGAFAKTSLLAPGESQILSLMVTMQQMASFDDTGRVQYCANVLEAGEYRFYLGCCVRDAVPVEYALRLEEDIVVEQLSEKLRPNQLSERLTSDGQMEPLPTGEAPDLDECLFDKLTAQEAEGVFPAVRAQARYYRGQCVPEGIHSLREVYDGSVDPDTFLDQLSDEDLMCLLGGVPDTGVANTCGFGGQPRFGIPAVMTADGPAGIRIRPECGIPATAWPCETLLASTWDTDLMYRVGQAAGEELKENNLQIWLAPAMNIHRNALCGRNFEYFSEDPYLTGRLAAAMVNGIQSNGVSACVKHFACNNKETNRKNSDSRVSMRALREIYLKGFEIVIKEAQPWTLMSSYNAINGQRASESRDLLTGILREEWGYTGVVTTDWWTRGEHYKEILAGNDIKMACGFPERVQKAMEMGALTREDLCTCARRVLTLICRLD